MALVTGLLVLYNISPVINYSLAKHNPISRKQIITILNNDSDKTESVKQLFAESINKNYHLNSEEKARFIDAFNTYFLNDNARYLDEDTIINMCMVARTQDVKKINRLAENYVTYYGRYAPITNRISYNADAKDQVLAHEELHAILRHGLANSGFLDNYLKLGTAVNEGMTESYTNKGNGVYYDERLLAASIGMIIGNDKISEYYLKPDLELLINELCKYSSKEETIELLKLSDEDVYRDREYRSRKNLIDAAERFGLIDSSSRERRYSLLDEEYYNEDYYNRQERKKSILINMYETKIGKKLDEDPFGAVLKYSNNFQSNDDQDSQALNYSLVFIDPDHTKIVFRMKETETENGYSSELTLDNDKLQNLDLDELTKLAAEKVNMDKGHIENASHGSK